jgi:hypothetical protein
MPISSAARSCGVSTRPPTSSAPFVDFGQQIPRRDVDLADRQPVGNPELLHFGTYRFTVVGFVGPCPEDRDDEQDGDLPHLWSQHSD